MITSVVMIEWPSIARAPRSRAKLTAARASSRLTPCLRNLRRMKKHVTAQTLSSALSSSRSCPGDAIVADQALVVAPRLDRAPAHRLPVEVGHETAVVSDSGWPASVC